MWAVVSEPRVTVLSTVNVTSALPLSSVDVGDRADLDSGHPDVIAGGEAAGFGEHGLIASCVRPLMSRSGCRPTAMTRMISHDADESGADESRITVFEHYSVHLPLSCLMNGKTAVRPCRSETRTDSSQM